MIASEIYCNQGILAASQNQFGIAQRRMNSALELDPQNSHAHFYRGRLLIEAGKVDQGIVSLKRATELNSDYLEASQQIITENKRR